MEDTNHIETTHEYVLKYYPQSLLGGLVCPVCGVLSQEEFVKSHGKCKDCFYSMLGFMSLAEKQEEARSCEDVALMDREETEIRLGVMFEDMIEGMASRDMARDPFVR